MTKTPVSKLPKSLADPSRMIDDLLWSVLKDQRAPIAEFKRGFDQDAIEWIYMVASDFWETLNSAEQKAFPQSWIKKWRKHWLDEGSKTAEKIDHDHARRESTSAPVVDKSVSFGSLGFGRSVLKKRPDAIQDTMKLVAGQFDEESQGPTGAFCVWFLDAFDENGSGRVRFDIATPKKGRSARHDHNLAINALRERNFDRKYKTHFRSLFLDTHERFRLELWTRRAEQNNRLALVRDRELVTMLYEASACLLQIGFAEAHVNDCLAGALDLEPSQVKALIAAYE